MRIDEFKGFRTDNYIYPLARQRKDGLVRVHGFASTKPLAWRFICDSVLRNEKLYGVGDLDDPKRNVVLVDPAPHNDAHLKRRLTKEGRELLFALMPDNVLDAVAIFAEVWK
jgi:hypothetical protein